MIDFGAFIFYILIPMTEFISTLYAGLDHTMEMLFLTNCTYVCVAVSDNLIDLSCEGTAPGPLHSEPEYVNDAVIRQQQLMDQRDPFDMREYCEMCWRGRGGQRCTGVGSWSC